jgi:two-component system chemotaxis response regulator CheY
MSILHSIDKNIPTLVIDDFTTMRRIVKGCLKQLGFENITEAVDGQIGLAKLTGMGCKLIISDWNMPNMMGIDLLKAVRADARFKAIPFLMVSAEAQKENIIEAVKAGVSSYIIKPFTADSMQEKLEAIFSKT